MNARADVALILEGTYPYVAGGVSTWVDQILHAYPNRRFALIHIGPHPGAYGEPRYAIPGNVAMLTEIHCRGAGELRGRGQTYVEPTRPRRALVSRICAADASG